MFAERNGSLQSGLLSNSQATALGTAAVSMCLLMSLIVAGMIGVSVILLQEHTAAFDGGCAPIWLYCLVACILIVFQLATGGGKNAEGNIGLLGFIFLGSSVAMAVWGVGMWVGMGEQCAESMEATHYTLMLLFKVCVVLIAVQSVMIVVLILGGAMLIAFLMGRQGQMSHSAGDQGTQGSAVPPGGTYGSVGGSEPSR